MFRKKLKKYQSVLILLAIIILVGLFYGGTLKNGFIHDDHGQVEQNTYIQSLSYLPKIFTSCIWESAVGNCRDTYYYRPLQSFSYMVTYQFSSHPWVFHLVNLVYFIIDIWLVYLLINLLTDDKQLAILTAAIFFIHPLNTEVVNWIAAVPELLYLLFVLLSTTFFVLYRRSGRTKYLWSLGICFIFGILAKEPAAFLPFVFIVLDITFFNKKFKDLLQWKNIKPYVFSLISFFVYMGIRFRVLGGLGADPYYKLTLPQRTYIFVDLFGEYFRKLIFPYPLNLFYTFHPTYQIAHPDFIIGVIIAAAFVGLFYIAVKKHWKIFGFSLVWYFVFLAPSLIFINSIGENLFAERHVFASTVAFAVFLALFLEGLSKRNRLGKVIIIAILCIVTVSSFFVIFERNKQWRTDEMIYKDTLIKNPDADLIRYNLAYLYEQSGKTNAAKIQYGEIVKRNVWRGLSKVFNNLGDIARKQGDFSIAAKYFQKSLAIDPLHVEAYNNLGAMYFEQGNLLKSLTFLCKANSIDPSFQPANNNYDRLVNIIQGMDGKTFGILYQTLIKGPTFHLDPGNKKFILENKDCSMTADCFLTYATHLPANAFIFPFLIGGQANDEQIVRPNRVGFKQATGEIILGIDKKWADANIDFSFPTCDGFIY